MDEIAKIAMLQTAYRNFNARRVEEVLAMMTENVQWPNRLDGGHLVGKDAVRAYWQRQFAVGTPQVEPLSIERDAQGRYEVRVHQTVRDLGGKLLSDAEVKHHYTISNSLIARMDVED